MSREASFNAGRPWPNRIDNPASIRIESSRIVGSNSLWKLMEEDREIQVTDRAAAYLGFLEGIQAVNAK